MLTRRKFLRRASGLLVPIGFSSLFTKGQNFSNVSKVGGWTKYAAVSSITPLSFSGIQAWWKADSFVGSNGDPVGTWIDSSTNSRNATQSTTANKPLYATNIFNGLPAIEFTTGAAKYLDFTGLTIGASGDYTFVKVGNIGGDGGVWNDGTNSVQFREFFTGLDVDISYNGTLVNTSSTFSRNTGYPGTTQLYCVFFRRTGTTHSWRENKTARGTATEGLGFTISRLSFVANPYVGYMGENIIYNSYLSDADCDSLYDNYLKSRWGLP